MYAGLSRYESETITVRPQDTDERILQYTDEQIFCRGRRHSDRSLKASGNLHPGRLKPRLRVDALISW